MRIIGSLLLVAACGMVLMSSCTKKYTCQCKVTYSGAPGLPDSSVREYEIYNSKSGAESECEEASYEHEEDGIKVKEECALY